MRSATRIGHWAFQPLSFTLASSYHALRRARLPLAPHRRPLVRPRGGRRQQRAGRRRRARPPPRLGAARRVEKRGRIGPRLKTYTDGGRRASSQPACGAPPSQDAPLINRQAALARRPRGARGGHDRLPRAATTIYTLRRRRRRRLLPSQIQFNEAFNIVLLGPPGTGKGTQAAFLKKTCGLQHLAVTTIMREAVAAGTENGQKAEAAKPPGV